MVDTTTAGSLPHAMRPTLYFVQLFKILAAVHSSLPPLLFEQLLTLCKTDSSHRAELFEPYFVTSDAPNTSLSAFVALRTHMCQHGELYEGLVRLCESFAVQLQVYDILVSIDSHADARFEAYMDCLDLSSPTRLHGEIIGHVWDCFERELQPHIVQRLRIVFAEAVVSQEFAMDQEVMLKARNLISNDALYLAILTALSEHHTCNMTWIEVRHI
eukprot:jgi/Hompol1/1982/HPOL_005811-RA